MSKSVRTPRERREHTGKRLWAGRQYLFGRGTAPSIADNYTYGDPDAPDTDRVTARIVRYNSDKITSLRDVGQHGGFRDASCKLSQELRAVVLSALARQIEDEPASRLEELIDVANGNIRFFYDEGGLEGPAPRVSESYVRRVFWSWGFIWKKRVPVQSHKFTDENLQRYANYLIWVAQQPLERLKFGDEVHFVPRGALALIQCVHLIFSAVGV